MKENYFVNEFAEGDPQMFDVYRKDKLVGLIYVNNGQAYVHPADFEEIDYNTCVLYKSFGNSFDGKLPSKIREKFLDDACEKIDIYREEVLKVRNVTAETEEENGN